MTSGVPTWVLVPRGVPLLLAAAASPRVVLVQVVVVVAIMTGEPTSLEHPETAVTAEVPEGIQVGQAASLPATPTTCSTVPRTVLRATAEAIPRAEASTLAVGKGPPTAKPLAGLEAAVGTRRVAYGGRLRGGAD